MPSAVRGSGRSTRSLSLSQKEKKRKKGEKRREREKEKDLIGSTLGLRRHRVKGRLRICFRPGSFEMEASEGVSSADSL